jgi:hypothetical protein
LIVGRDHGSAIGTLVERQTRMIRLLHLTQRDGRALHCAIAERMTDLPPSLLRSITWDQGAEMAHHTDITAELGIPIYFCDAHAPWQRGSNENANGLLRQYFPKRTDLSVHGPDHLRAVEDEINARPPDCARRPLAGGTARGIASRPASLRMAVPAGLDELATLGRTLQRRRDDVLAYFTHRASNGPTEAINGRLQALRRTAPGFRNLINYRIRSLLHCGALAL